VDTIDIADYSKNPTEKKSYKIEAIRASLWKYLHVGAHDGYNVTREDAEFALVLYMSVLRYYGVQMDKVTREE
jgi:hypothetical protein